MRKLETPLKDLFIIELDVHRDARGFFMERFQREKFHALGLTVDFVQDNHSRSVPGVLRGMHYQIAPGQGKLVGCLRGRIFDVAVDLRRDSPSFGKWFGVELNDQNGRLLWVPRGFAHGFCILGEEEADVMYKVDSFYAPKLEKGLRWDDSELNISWPIASPKLAEKDLSLPSFADYRAHPDF